VVLAHNSAIAKQMRVAIALLWTRVDSNRRPNYRLVALETAYPRRRPVDSRRA
jgi:hypothetical protein